MTRLLLATLTAALNVAWTAPAVAAPYQPLDPQGRDASGYSQVQLQPDRWRVTYLGDPKASREAVEADLLRRAAELTLAQGYVSFSTVDEEVSRPDTPRSPKPAPAGWSPNWRYFGEGFGWQDWNPERQDPLWRSETPAQGVRRFEASEEIQMHGPAHDGGVSPGVAAQCVLRGLDDPRAAPC